MPLVYVPAVTPPEPPPGPTPKPPPYLAQAPYVTWTPNGGPEMILVQGASQVAEMLAGAMGFGMPPEVQARSGLVGDGSLLNHRRAGTGELMLPVKVLLQGAANMQEFHQRRRKLIDTFDPELGYGVLRWALPDSSWREITCIYESGLNSPVAGEQGAVLLAHHQIILRADDPYWYGSEQLHTFDPPNSRDFFLPPGDPDVVYISEASTTGERDVFIDGRRDVFPIWEQDGPCTTLEFTNDDTGKTLNLNANLAAGQTLVIRTSRSTLPAERITRAGVNVWTSVVGINNFPNLWSLRPGMNHITVLVNGTEVGLSQTRLRYRPRYLSS